MSDSRSLFFSVPYCVTICSSFSCFRDKLELNRMYAFELLVNDAGFCENVKLESPKELSSIPVC